ncbi:hypothetical protein BJF78_35335 [Pseudonocardia sp. CNS-139]|nr:hypothetical protein BJF78_35335 [Pseudonocardia sp. CNS-139]
MPSRRLALTPYATAPAPAPSAAIPSAPSSVRRPIRAAAAPTARTGSTSGSRRVPTARVRASATAVAASVPAT